MKSSFERHPLPGTAPGFVARGLGIACDPETPAMPAEIVSLTEVPAAVEDGLAREAEIEAHAQVLQALQNAVTAFDASVLEARQVIAREQRAWLQGALDLAVALAERILERELAIDPDALHPLIARAAELVGEGGALTVALPEETYALLEAEMPGRLESLQRDREVHFRPDAGLSAGESRVSSGASEVEVGVQSMLAQLRDELREVWHVDASASDAAEGERT